MTFEESALTQGKQLSTDEDADRLLADGIAAWHRADYSAAETLLDLARKLSPRPASAQRRADCLKNLGIVYRRTGRFALAEQAYQRAWNTYERLGARKESADCLKNLGVLFRCTGRLPEAEDACHRASFIYTELGLAKQVADCAWNLGVVRRLQGRLDDAESAYLKARGQFISLGLRLECARVDLDRGLARLLLDDSQQPDVARRILDLWVPAVLYLDAVRFQFPSPAARRAWHGTIQIWYQRIFELAATSHDHQLVADLVESTINNGYYPVAPPSGDHGIDIGAEPSESVGLPDPFDDERPGTKIHDREGPALTMKAGASRLIAGTTLRLAPAPHLLAPYGRGVLADHWALVASSFDDPSSQAPQLPIW